MRRIFVLAAEASGDLYAGLVARALLSLSGQADNQACSVDIQGIGGAEMKSAGVGMMRDYSDHAVLGFMEGIRAIPAAMRLISELRCFLSKWRPDVFVPVSYGGVNLVLGKYARSLGIRVVYLSPPQVWAWGQWRHRALARAADKLICLFPFEPEFFRRLGISAEYLGNPLLDETEGLSAPSDPHPLNLVLMPGSRPSEIARHLPLMNAVAQQLRREIPELQTEVLSLGNRTKRYQRMAQASLIIAASGTAVLETALMNVPTIALYRLAPVSYLIARGLVKTRYVALPNIIVDKEVVPELIQSKTCELLPLARRLLLDTDRRNEMKANLRRVREALGEDGAAERIACEILNPQ